MIDRAKLYAELIAGLLVLLALVYGLHRFVEHERQQGRDEIQTLWDKQKAADEKAAAQDRARWAKQSQGAENNATDRQQVNQAAAAAAGAVAGSLRDAIRSFSETNAGDTAAAARKDAATLGSLLADCEGRYRGMAEIADGHSSDVRMLKEAWPTNGGADGKEKAK